MYFSLNNGSFLRATYQDLYRSMVVKGILRNEEIMMEENLGKCIIENFEIRYGSASLVPSFFNFTSLKFNC